MLSNLFSDPERLIVISATVLIRILCLIIVQSYFVPDEYYQSIEIAHRTVFGYGYITWEWDKAIRSFFYPFWFSLVYKFFEIVKLDYIQVLTVTPRILQLILSTVADLYYWEWLNLEYGRKNKNKLYWTYFMWLMCLIINYCSTRTITNTAELNFTIIALYYYKCHKGKLSSRPHFLWFIGLACLVRPTAFIQWLPICMLDILSNSNPFKYCLTVYIKIICKTLCLSVVVDYLFYKRVVLTPLQFIIYNGRYNIGIHYGVHSWFWYVLSGIPTVLGPVVIIFYYTLFKFFNQILHLTYKGLLQRKPTIFVALNSRKMLLLLTIIWSICWYSIVPHKEFRFILPLVPKMLYLAGTQVDFYKLRKQNTFKYYVVLCTSVGAVICNLFGLIYLGQWHQTGPITVASKLAQIAKENPESSFLFLTPCHATPLYSHLHVNVTTRFITCEPNLDAAENYQDESDIFFENPQQWLYKYVDNKDNSVLPSHLIFFDNLKSSIQTFLNHYNYTRHDIVFHSHFPQERQSQYIEIYILSNKFLHH